MSHRSLAFICFCIGFLACGLAVGLRHGFTGLLMYVGLWAFAFAIFAASGKSESES